METNRLRPEDQVNVRAIDANGNVVADFTGTGYHDIAEAINATAPRLPAGTTVRDYAFQVSDLTTGTSNRYFVNAGGHPRLNE